MAKTGKLIEKNVKTGGTQTGPQLGDSVRGNNYLGTFAVGTYVPSVTEGIFYEPDKFGVPISSYEYWEQWSRKLERMRLDPTLAMLRQLFIAPILAAGWHVDADDDVPDEMIDFAKEEMDAVHLDLIRQAGLGCLDFGWAPFEKVFHERPDGLIGYKKIKSLLQEMTTIVSSDETGAFEGLENGEVFLGLEYSLLFNFDVRGTDWYGQAPMRAAELPYNMSNEINRSRGKLNTRIAASHWVIYYPVGITILEGQEVDNYVLADRVMTRLLQEGSITLPNEIRSELNILNGDAASGDYQAWRVEQLSSGGDSSAGFYTEQLRYEDALKARAIGFPERAILEGQFGTKAEAEAHGDVATMGLEKRARELTQTMSQHGLRQLIEINFGEEWKNKLRLLANPMVDKTRALFLKIYETFLSNPDLMLAEYDQFDLQQLHDRLGLPMLEEGTNSGNVEDNVIEVKKTINEATPQIGSSLGDPGDGNDGDDVPNLPASEESCDCDDQDKLEDVVEDEEDDDEKNE